MPENPYEPPHTPGDTKPARRISAGRIVGSVAILLLLIPAAVTAFFGVCFAAASVAEQSGVGSGSGNGQAVIMTGVWIGGFSALVVACLMIWAAVALLRRK